MPPATSAAPPAAAHPKKRRQRCVKSAAPPAEANPKKGRQRCVFEDGMAEHSGEGTDGGEDSSEEEETAYDRSFIDDSPVKGKRRRLPRVTEAEKVVDEDEVENLKDTCLELCKGQPKKKAKRAYADKDDEDNATLSDLDFISESSCDDEEEEIRQTEKKTKTALDAYVAASGVAKKGSFLVETHKDARNNAFDKTLKYLEDNSGPPGALKLGGSCGGRRSGGAPAGPRASAGAPAGPRVRPTEAHRQLAPVFLGQGKAKPGGAQSKPGAPGLVVNPVTKQVYYRHGNGRLSPRPSGFL